MDQNSSLEQPVLYPLNSSRCLHLTSDNPAMAAIFDLAEPDSKPRMISCAFKPYDPTSDD